MALKKVAATLLAFALAVQGCDKCGQPQDTCNKITIAVYQSCGIPSKTKTIYPPPTCTRPPTVSDVPSCAQACVSEGEYGGCKEGDVGCICRNKSYLEGLTGCVARKCRGVECQDVVDFAKGICGNVGVTDLPIPSCLPPPPTVTDVPSCAQVCVTQGQYGGCAEGDVGCICRNKSYLEGLTGCVSENCKGVNCQDVVDFAKDVCGAVGVTDLPIPSCSPAPPTVTDVPSCGQMCVTAGSYGGCREGDVGCICRNTQYLEGLSECVGRSCNVTGCAEVASFAGDLCSSVGVTSLPMPSCGTLTSTMVPPLVTDVPDCAQNCVLSAGGYGGCSESDSCDTSGCQSVAAYATTLCRNYGVSSLPALSCPAVTATTTERTVQITTAPGQTITTTAPLTIRPPAETVTASTVSTLTIISTAPPLTVSITQTQYGPTATSLVISTVETSVERTVTLPASSYTTTFFQSGTTVTSLVTQPASTIVETEVSFLPITLVETTTAETTLERTVTLPASSYTTTFTESGSTVTSVVTQPPSTAVETVISFVPTTVVSTQGILTQVTTLQETVTSTAPGSTITATYQTTSIIIESLPGETETLPAETQTLPAETQTLPPGTLTIISTQPASTPRITETQPGSIITVTSTTTPPPVTVIITTTAPPAPPGYNGPTTTTTTTTPAPPGYVGPTTTTTRTTTTTTPAPAPSACPNGISGGTLSGSCPADDRRTFTDASGVQYVIGCDMDIRAANLIPQMAANSYTLCLQRCSTGSFTDANGASQPCHGTTHFQGFCYFQSYIAQQSFTPRTGVIAAIRPAYLQGYVAPAGTCSQSLPPVTTTTSTSSAGNPPGYVGPSTTSTRTTTAPVTFTSAPPRLSCANMGWLVQEQAWYTVDIATGNTVRNGTINLPQDVRMQAIGYNRLDGYIYGTNGLGTIQRFGLDLQPQSLQGGFNTFQTGDVDEAGHYWAMRTSIDPVPYVQFDVNPTSPTYGNVLRQGTIPRPQYFFADWAYVPGGGDYLWAVGVDRTGNGQTTSTGFAYLYRFTQATLALDIVYAYGNIGVRPDNDLVNFGAVYASSEPGVLYGSENNSGNIYRFTVLPPYTWAIIASGPTTEQNDGARCIDQPVVGVQTSTRSVAPAAPSYRA
ncbi:Putative extracellular membrane protein, CFEM [Septoria linicola]|uniref:Extracellular membrane protein, CFEM n=1 Tax=Septoria linicola TaxID=215465 RepID=A0A9Q9B214_9PEZI|nr:putative extracellular membrane protein, CFEM [Septoria linicola]USW59210.1 Putative extracellular membrane protein, CFEM [Septoria linicola]